MDRPEVTKEQFLKLWKHMIAEADLPTGKRKVIMVPLHGGAIIEGAEGEPSYEFEMYDVETLQLVNPTTGELQSDKVLDWFYPVWEGEQEN